MKIRTVLRCWDERLSQFGPKQRLRVSLRLLLLQILQMLLLSPDISLVCGAHDIEVVENLVEVCFSIEHRIRGPCKALSSGGTNKRSTSFPWREQYQSAQVSSIRRMSNFGWLGDGALALA
jgi:hypothetical protein